MESGQPQGEYSNKIVFGQSSSALSASELPSFRPPSQAASEIKWNSTSDSFRACAPH